VNHKHFCLGMQGGHISDSGGGENVKRIQQESIRREIKQEGAWKSERKRGGEFYREGATVSNGGEAAGGRFEKPEGELRGVAGRGCGKSWAQKMFKSTHKNRIVEKEKR